MEFTTMFQCKELPESEGRNGLFKTKGATAMMLSDRVAIAGITSAGKVGRGSIALPRDPQTLRIFASQLEAVANDLEKTATRSGESEGDGSGAESPWYRNFYECDCGERWPDEWDSMCDDRCPECDTSCSPVDSVRLN